MQPCFSISGLMSSPTAGQGQQTKGQALQTKTKSEGSGNPAKNDQSCHLGVGWKAVEERGGIPSPCACFLEQLKLI